MLALKLKSSGLDVSTYLLVFYTSVLSLILGAGFARYWTGLTEPPPRQWQKGISIPKKKVLVLALMAAVSLV